MMAVDSTGKKYNRLTAIRPNGKNKHGNIKWLCLCDCGNYTTVLGTHLRNGTTKSCGCLLKEYNEQFRADNPKKGYPLYAVWGSMLRRCENPRDAAYKNYGSRGIKVCDEWHEFEAFEKWAIDTGYVRGLDLDRTDNGGNYCPENCRWVTRKTNNNNKRNNVIMEYQGKSMTLSQWSEELGISKAAIYTRHHSWGDDVDKVLATQKMVEGQGGGERV